MTGFRFTCSYTTAKDPDGTSPCGRPATPREHRDSRCLGHRVLEWHLSIHGRGGPERVRSVYGFIYTVRSIACLSTGIRTAAGAFTAADRPYAAVEAAVSLLLAVFLAGFALGFTLEHPLGGRLWLAAAPLSSVAVVLSGGLLLSGANPGPVSRLADVVHAFGLFVTALGVFAGWAVFLLRHTGRHRSALGLTILCELMFIAVVAAGIVLALVSRGQQSGVLIMLLVVIGLAVLVRGANRLKSLARTLRI
ncbi:hypothetical protein E1286_06295 [Nonomuraea terrae]|uniref:Uncharacterized protein n=1 Tax=Nonomuraea terrae TaxID=2530383 RepID=A0A4V6PE21_9ACTN|nr:hypothetical protein [Nonomuraea terrae]TDD54107.1 hypothetical protein E1286_06295 [Nonomuraea terrae]